MYADPQEPGKKKEREASKPERNMLKEGKMMPTTTCRKVEATQGTLTETEDKEGDGSWTGSAGERGKREVRGAMTENESSAERRVH